MVKYKVNLKFKDASKSLNEIITEVLKVKLSNRYFNGDLPYNNICYFHVEGSNDKST